MKGISVYLSAVMFIISFPDIEGEWNECVDTRIDSITSRKTALKSFVCISLWQLANNFPFQNHISIQSSDTKIENKCQFELLEKCANCSRSPLSKRLLIDLCDVRTCSLECYIFSFSLCPLSRCTATMLPMSLTRRFGQLQGSVQVQCYTNRERTWNNSGSVCIWLVRQAHWGRGHTPGWW